MQSAAGPRTCIQQLVRVCETVRPLRWTQIWHQLARRVYRKPLLRKPSADSPKARPLKLTQSIAKPRSMWNGRRFRFLNREADLGLQLDWSARRMPLLWRYNLHYFDYLQQRDITCNVGFKLMRDWTQNHQPCIASVGWHPYPSSLRIVNWVKFMVANNGFPGDLLRSLHLQAENLERQVEYHLLGNHLFSNGKALWFAGVFFQQARWSEQGRAIIVRQLEEQFLPDGGHFELSPMYHSLAMEDLLDLVNLCAASGDDESASLLHATVVRAARWLSALVDAGGEFPLLNDAAYGIAPTYATLAEYSTRLGIESAEPADAVTLAFDWTCRDLSGYRVLQNGHFRIIFDTALLGPDYLPGHAHCDMLSLLLDYRGRSILTDTGVYEYEDGTRRTYCRSTAAHNTVALDELEQGDIWKSFRMGKRGRPSGVKMEFGEIACEHSGYRNRSRGLGHRRTLRLLENGFEVLDSVRGPGHHRFRTPFHFAPGVVLKNLGSGRFCIGNELTFETWEAAAEVATSEYYPEFGAVETRPCLVLEGTFRDQHQFGIRCTYSS